jgi:hypothetical protein
LRAALGGHMPGDSLAARPTSARGAYYTPIAGDVRHGFHAQPIFYGMLLANQFAGARLLSSSLQTAGVNATAYAAKTQATLRIAVFNKSDSQDLRLKIQTASSHKHTAVWRLIAPTLDATSAPTFAGSEIGPHAQWSPTHVEALQSTPQGQMLELPRSSAALVFLD